MSDNVSNPTLLILVVQVGRLRHLGRCCPFRVSWRAVSFPLAAVIMEED
jgi:tellurite resistance protein